MKNEQIFCDKCGKLLIDPKQGIEETRHQASVQLTYSAIGDWGYAEEAVERKTQTGFCVDCFYEIWVAVSNLAEVIERKIYPIRTYNSHGKFFDAVKKIFRNVRPY